MKKRLMSLLMVLLMVLALLPMTALAEDELLTTQQDPSATEDAVLGKGGPNPTFTVTYVADKDTTGTVPTDSNKYSKDATVTVKGQASLEKSGHAFVGWNTHPQGKGTSYQPGDTFTISSNVKLYAQWVKTYTVTFKDYNGTVLKTQQVNPGGSATAPDVPSREGYNFDGWDKPFNNVTNDLTVTAKYKLITYKITYIPNGGTVTGNPTTYNIESNSITLKNPTKANYTFLGWSGTGITGMSTNVVIPKGSTGDRTYTANWEINKYTVTFDLNYTGSSTFSKTVDHGQPVEKPADPEREGFAFVGWEYKVGSKWTLWNFETGVTNNIYLKAKWVEQYTVTFDPDNGQDSTVVSVNKGDKVVKPTDPTKKGYIFEGWFQGKDRWDFNKSVVKNITLKAKWKAIDYTVSYDANGATSGTAPVDTKKYHINDDVIVKGVGNLNKDGYDFVGWNTQADGSGTTYTQNTKFKMGDSNVTLYAQWKIKTYTVTFKDHDGTELATQTVNHGAAATAPADPTREGYNFTGWDKVFNKVTSDLTVTAQYKIKTYTVTFKDHDGKELATQTVAHGAAATAPADPTREGYNFTGWDKAFDKVTSDVTVTAQYKIKTYTVTFKDHDGKELGKQTVDHGAAATAPVNPVRDGHNFTGWDKAFDRVTSDLTIIAKYVIKTYTVKFVDYNGTVLSEQKVDHGAAAKAPANPARDGYTFTGWDKEFASIKGDLEVKAQYKQKASKDEGIPKTFDDSTITLEDETIPAQGQLFGIAWWWIVIGGVSICSLAWLIVSIIRHRRISNEVK